MARANKVPMGSVWNMIEKLDAVELVTKAVKMRSFFNGEFDMSHYEGTLRKWNVDKDFASTRRAGMCSYTKRTIELHSELFVEGREEDLRSTFMHELAHLLDFLTSGNGKHGNSWRLMMVALGRRPSRTCSYDFLGEGSAVRAKKVSTKKARKTVKCDRCEQEVAVGPTVYKRILKGERGYTHNKCGGTITV